jgi:hypothetical protein
LNRLYPVHPASAQPKIRDWAWESFQQFQAGVPVAFVTGQREMPADSLRGDKLLEQ